MLNLQGSLSFTKQMTLLVGIISLTASSFIFVQSELVTKNQFGSFDSERGLIGFLDYDKRTLHSITVDGKKYQVIEYKNYIPYVDGIEVVRSDGTLVTNTNTVKKIFNHIGWIEAAKKYSNSDLEMLRSILNFSNELYDYIYPINSKTSSVLSVVDKLKYDWCIDVLVFRGCAWDLVEYQLPGISTVESVVRELNTELTSWTQATYDIQNKLPSTISVIEQLKFNKKVSSNLESNIRGGISSLSRLEGKSNELAETLYDISSVFSSIKNSLYDASDLPLIGGVIYETAGFFGGIENDVLDLYNQVNGLSDILSSQRYKLDKVIDDADHKSDELYNSWSMRQNALPLWNLIITIGIALIIGIAVLVPLFVKRKQIMRS